MVRQWRIEYEDALYHIMSRGNGGGNIVSDDEDRVLFLTVLEEMAERFDIRVHAWVLMTNHYHLLLRTPKANLSKSMQWFGATYTRRYNVKHKIGGHLFQGRFKSLLVENDHYLFHLSCYIHRNPLRAKMVKRLADYKWSSYRIYAHGDQNPGWFETDLILSQIGGEDRCRAYREIVQRYSGEEKQIAENIHMGIATGSKAFAEYIKTKFMPENPDSEIPQQKWRIEDYNITLLLKRASQILDCDVDTFKKAGRIKATDKINRDLLVYMLWNTGVLTNKEIGIRLGLTYSAVSHCIRAAKDMKKDNREFKKGFEKINSLFKI